MARMVKKDTFLYEDAGNRNLVRRQVFAGQYVPDHYEEGDDTEGGAFEEQEGPGRGPGLGAGEAEYSHNRGASVKEQLERRGMDSSDEAAEAYRSGGAARQQYDAKQQERSRSRRKPVE